MFNPVADGYNWATFLTFILIAFVYVLLFNGVSKRTNLPSSKIKPGSEEERMQCMPRCGSWKREDWEDASFGDEDEEEEENFYVELVPEESVREQ